MDRAGPSGAANSAIPPPESSERGRSIAFGSDERAAAASSHNILICHSGRASRASPGKREPESSNQNSLCLTPAVDYWVPARASPVEPGSLGRGASPYGARGGGGGGGSVRG